jgi:integrase
LLRALREVLGNPYFFPGHGTVGLIDLKQIQRLWEKVREGAGLPDIQIDDLRHNAGGWMAALNANPFAMRNVLGHSEVTMTSRYTNPVSEARAASEQLEQALTGVLRGDQPEPERPASRVVK